MSQDMTSSRPYMVRALHEWIIDNQCTPYLLVNALADDVDVPRQFVKDGQIVLNVSPSAVINFHVDTDGVSFNGRFGGIPTDVYVPVSAVMGIYARENGQGMVFDQDEMPDDPGPGHEPPPADPPLRPSLKIVK